MQIGDSEFEIFVVPVPSNRREIAKGRRIISFKGLHDQDKYTCAADVLEGVIEASMACESETLRLLLVLEEVLNFLKKAALVGAKAEAERVQRLIEQIAREGRKYGIGLLILSQTIRDFAREAAVVRQNISTRVFMRNNDREIEYAADYLDDGKAIINLSPGEAFVCNPEWGTARIRVRPPLSKVWEPNDKEVEGLVGSPGEMQRTLSQEAQAVLDLVREHDHKTGQPARLNSIAETLGITSRRKLGRIVEELKKASVVKFKRLKERGKPLTIEPLY